MTPGPRGVSNEHGVTIHRLGGEALFAWPGANARVRERPSRAIQLAPVAFRLAAKVGELGRFDHVVAHWIVPSAFPAGWTAIRRSPGAALEIVSHGADVRLLRSAPAGVRVAVLERLLAQGARFRFVAGALLDRLLEGLPASLDARLRRVSVIVPCPVDIPRKSSLADPRPALGLAGRYFVWVGRDIASKRLGLALDAARRADVELVVVGTPRVGPYQRARKLHFVDRVDRREALSWIAHATALVSTSSEEGAPTAIREARAFDIPVVACAAGDIERWAASDPGIRVVDASIESLARAIRSF